MHCERGTATITRLSDNSVYNNYLENIYLLEADNNTFSGNTTWGGQNSMYIKDSSFNIIEGNTLRDRTLVIRGDSHDNQLRGNTFIGAGVHFQVYTSETPYRHPHDNTLIGGSITGASTCVRFSSSWANMIDGDRPQLLRYRYRFERGSGTVSQHVCWRVV